MEGKHLSVCYWSLPARVHCGQVSACWNEEKYEVVEEDEQHDASHGQGLMMQEEKGPYVSLDHLLWVT